MRENESTATGRMDPLSWDLVTVGGPPILYSETKEREVLVWLTRDRPMSLTI